MTGIFKPGEKPGTGKYIPEQQKDTNFKPLGRCVSCGAVDVEIDKKSHCKICKTDTKADGVDPAHSIRKTDKDDDGTIYDMQ